MKKTILPVLARHKRLTAAVLALAVVLAAGGGAFALLHRKGGDAGDDLNYARTVTLTKGELTESVNVSGLVQSARVSSVTTSLTSKVVAVNVKVGDVVSIPGIGDVTILANGDLVEGQETAPENNGVVLLPERVVFTAENVADYPF